MSVQLNDALKAAFVVYLTGDDAKKSSALSGLDVQSFKDDDKKNQQQQQQQQQEGHLAPGTMTEETVIKMTEVFNDLMDKINCDVEFQYNKELDMFNVKMIDKKTNEVIKEFPPEEMIENMIKAKDWLGAFIDRAI